MVQKNFLLNGGAHAPPASSLIIVVRQYASADRLRRGPALLLLRYFKKGNI